MQYALGFARTRKIQTRVLLDENFKTRVGLGFLQDIVFTEVCQIIIIIIKNFEVFSNF